MLLGVTGVDGRILCGLGGDFCVFEGVVWKRESVI